MLPRLRPLILMPLLAILACCLLAGCANNRPAAREIPRDVREIAVLDFLPLLGEERPAQKREGWWFGEENVLRNPNIGMTVADSLSSRLDLLPMVDTMGRVALADYLEQKREQLRAAFPSKSAGEYDAMLRAIPPVDYGLELGLDQIVSGEILEAYTSYSPFWRSWKSVVRVRVVLWDVATGRIFFQEEFNETGHYASQVSLLRAMSDQVAQALRRYYAEKGKDK